MDCGLWVKRGCPMTTEIVLIQLWRTRKAAALPYLLINDTRGYFGANSPEAVSVEGAVIPVHVCSNECALRLCTEAERESQQPTNRIIISRKQLEPDHLPDLQASSSALERTLTGIDVSKAMGVENPRPILDRLPISVFWGLAPFLRFLNDYSFERVLLASLLGDETALSAGWTPEQVLDKLWYEGILTRLKQVLAAVEPEEKRVLEAEFLRLLNPWLDSAQRAVVEVAVLEEAPPPVLPLCLLTSILEGWGTLDPPTLRKFLDGSELGDLFVDVLQDGNDLSGLGDWGRRIAFRADDRCSKAITYLETEVFPRRPEALAEALTTVVSAVSGRGEQRLVRQLVRLLESDGGLLAQGLAITLSELLGISNISALSGLPLEPVPIDLTDRLESAEAQEWQRLLELLRRHQSREKYEDHVALLEAMITLHRLTGKAEALRVKTAGLGWNAWLDAVDRIYLPLSAQLQEALVVSARLPGHFEMSKVGDRARQALAAIAADYVKFYTDSNTGLQKWIRDKIYQAGTSRPWLN